MLSTVPTEILHEISLRLLEDSPLGPPSALQPLQLLNRSFHETLTHPHLFARIFRYKFDANAVARRAYLPTANDLAAQLKSWCHALRVIRAGDVHHEDAEDALLSAWTMMLDNDGKNRAQLEWAGVEAFAERWVVEMLGADAGRNEGWPVDELGNACAVWLMWLFTTRQKLVEEAPAKRELIVSQLLPFVLNPYRYTSAHAPPAHYALPITTAQTHMGSNQTHHGPYPIYPTTEILTHHFGSVPALAPPLITIAAKLVYFSRREVIPFGIPPHLPEDRDDAIRRGVEGPTKADMREVNGYMGARMVDRVVWDWNRGERIIHDAPLSLLPPPPSSSTSAKGKLPPPPEHYSQLFDADWWRHRLCYSPFIPRPKILPGHTYTPGSLSGLWQGRLLIPSEMAAMRLLHTSHVPQGGLSEAAMEVTTQPVFMRLFEHFAVGEGECVPTARSAAEAGILDDSGVEDPEGMRNAWFPGRIGGVQFKHVPPRNHSSSGRDRVRIETDPHGGEWVYETYDETRESEHREGTCERCRAREEVLERVRREEREEEERALAERVFGSVGLGMGVASSLSSSSSSCSADEEEGEEEDEEGEEDEEEDEDEVRELDIQFEMEGDEAPSGQPEFVGPDGVVIEGTRRTHGRAWVPKCTPGVQGVCVSGRTDPTHALAWNAYQFYGRVRPWDGLVGILRMARYPAINHVLFYGYVVNGRNFVGNWRVAGADAGMPCWESAFVMSRRET